MAKFKLTIRNSLTMVLAFLGSVISPNVFSQDADATEGENASPKTAGEAAKEKASGSLSAGAIAAAVAAAAALAAIVDSGDGGSAAPVPTPAPTPAPPSPTPAPTPAPTETYSVDVVVPTVVNVNTTTQTNTTTNTITGVYLPNTNTNTNTTTNTSTTTLTRYVTNTSTSTATATNTNTSTNTTTNTATKTYGTDADNDGFLQTTEINPSGNAYLFVDELDNQTANFEQEITQTFTFLQGAYDADAGPENIPGTPDGSIMQVVEIEQPVYAIDAFNDYNLPNGGTSVDDGVTILDANIEVVSGPDMDGWFTITQDIAQEINQDIVQDVFYETDLVQDFIQTQEINQTYTVDEIVTETRTRLAGD